MIARTSEPSLAYKCDTGLRGLTIQPTSRMLWRDVSNTCKTTRSEVQERQTSSAQDRQPHHRRGIKWRLDRGIPPPHSFFWAREIPINLGYSWYRKDSDTTYAFGIQQPEKEDRQRRRRTLPLQRASGTWQRMPIYFYVTADSGRAAMDAALAYTRQDRFKALPGYQVMATHFHTSSVSRINDEGSLDAKIPDLEAIKGAGINIFGPVDGGRLRGDRLAGQFDYYEIARRNSDKNFLFMPNEESSAGNIDGHEDVLVPRPVFWDYNRPAGTPFVEPHPKYGKVYHVGGPADMMELARLENMLIYMPHPRSKGSTGFPDAMQDTPQFLHDNYRGIGMRWGMGLDGSETRLCEIRCQTLLDDMNNWVADKPGPLEMPGHHRDLREQTW